MSDIEIVEINENQTDNAKLLASRLSNAEIRKRGMIDLLGISCAKNYFTSKRVKVDTRKSVYKIPLLYEEFKISDIYLGNYRIDVITIYKEKTIKIPKVHIDMDILPHFYFVVQIGTKIQEAKIIGFLDGKDIVKCSHDSKYYYPTIDMVFDFQRFSTLTKRSISSKTMLGKHVDCMGLFLKFIDNDLSSVYKKQLIQHLMNCEACRSRFIDTMEFDKLADNFRFYPELIKKYLPKIQILQEKDKKENFSQLENDINKFEIQEANEEEISEKEIVEKETKQDLIQKEKQEIIQSLNDEKTISQLEELGKIKKRKNTTKKTIVDLIFNEIPKIDMSSISSIVSQKHRRKILAFAIGFIIFIIFSLICVKTTLKSFEDSENLDNLPTLNEMDNSYQNDYENPQNYQQNEYQGRQLVNRQQNDYIIQPQQQKPNYAPTVTKVAWEAPESIVKRADYTKFLQLSGKNIKLNLQNDLLLVNDIAVNGGVKIDIKVSTSGEIEKITLVKTSGSNLIDASVEKIVNDTLRYMRPPNVGFSLKPIKLTLTIDMS